MNCKIYSPWHLGM